jgi:HSP20 family molecular chaperone IbpA
MSEQQVAQREESRPGIAMMPPVDVMEDEAGITLTADLPGVPKEKLTVRFDSDTLLIEGETELDVPEGMQMIYAEMRIPRFRRVFALSRELDPSRSEAVHRNGVLKLRIPKAEHARPRKIEVTVA